MQWEEEALRGCPAIGVTDSEGSPKKLYTGSVWVLSYDLDGNPNSPNLGSLMIMQGGIPPSLRPPLALPAFWKFLHHQLVLRALASTFTTSPKM